MVAPFAPHIAEELWERLGREGSIFDGAPWPDFDAAKAAESTVEIAVQVNGKLRATITVAKDAAEADVVAAARAEENVGRHLDGMTERRVIHVPGRLVNFVVG
jgi:leucyl-tRNA synthetase